MGGPALQLWQCGLFPAALQRDRKQPRAQSTTGGFALARKFHLWLGSLFFLGVVPTQGGCGLYTLSLRSLPPTVANLIATLEPAPTAIWADFLLKEQLTGIQLLGGVLIFAGVLLLRVHAR